MIMDPTKPGKLRGGFLDLYKGIYIDGQVRKLELSVIETFINFEEKVK